MSGGQNLLLKIDNPASNVFSKHVFSKHVFLQFIWFLAATIMQLYISTDLKKYISLLQASKVFNAATQLWKQLLSPPPPSPNTPIF